MTNGKIPSLVKPGVDTPFHIDYSWWQQNDREWSVYLRGLLGEELEAKLAELGEDQELDWVDPKTGEVRRMGAIQYLLALKFAEGEEQEQGVSMVEAIFREFLKNGNTPLSPKALGGILGRPANTILRTLSGARVYRGMRPILESSE